MDHYQGLAGWYLLSIFSRYCILQTWQLLKQDFCRARSSQWSMTKQYRVNSNIKVTIFASRKCIRYITVIPNIVLRVSLLDFRDPIDAVLRYFPNVSIIMLIGTKLERRTCSPSRLLLSDCVNTLQASFPFLHGIHFDDGCAGESWFTITWDHRRVKTYSAFPQHRVFLKVLYKHSWRVW